MTVTYRFFSNGDYYNQPDFAKLMKDAVGTGVVPNVEDELNVIATTPATMSVLVSLGRGYINGYSFDIETNPESVPIAQADDTYGRIDTIVARLSVTANKWVEIDAVTGTPSANPVPPALQQDEETWEMPLADVLVVANAVSIIDSNITDRRVEICDPQFKIDALTGVKVNGTTQPVTNHVADITVPDGSKSAKGVLKVGDNLSVSSGTVSVPIASSSVPGVVALGTNIQIDGIDHRISVPYASNYWWGVVTIDEEGNAKSGINITDEGRISTVGTCSIEVGAGKRYTSLGEVPFETLLERFTNLYIKVVGAPTVSQSSMWLRLEKPCTIVFDFEQDWHTIGYIIVKNGAHVHFCGEGTPTITGVSDAYQGKVLWVENGGKITCRNINLDCNNLRDTPGVCISYGGEFVSSGTVRLSNVNTSYEYSNAVRLLCGGVGHFYSLFCGNARYGIIKDGGFATAIAIDTYSEDAISAGNGCVLYNGQIR